MPDKLTAKALHKIQTPDTVIAEIVVTEPNGDEYVFRCVCRSDGTEVDGAGDALEYLNERYGDIQFSTTIREAALAGSTAI